MLSLKNISVAVELIPLINKEIKVNYIELNTLTLLVEVNKNGEINLVSKEMNKKKSDKEVLKSSDTDKPAQPPTVNIDRVFLSDANIVYNDLLTGSKTVVNNIDAQVENIVLSSAKDTVKGISLKGNMQIKSVKHDKFNIKNVDSSFNLKNTVVTVDPMQFTVFGSLSKGKAEYDMSGKESKIEIENIIEKFDLAAFSCEFVKSDKVSMDGFVKTDIKISARGLSPKEIKPTLSGKIYIAGSDFGIKGIDIDTILGQYDKSQNIDAIDVGAFLVAGPLGAALTKGADLGGTTLGIGRGKSAVKKLVLDIPVKNGIATLKDVAISTVKHRVAVKGGLDLKKEKFINVEVGVLDAKGCAKYSQKVSGTFKKPRIETAKLAVNTATGVVTSFFKKIKKAVSKREKCKPFYTGSVPHPDR